MAGGGTRCGPILETLGRHDADVVVLQETVGRRAGELCHVLRGRGYTFGLSAPRAAGERGLCVLARVPLRRIDRGAPPQAAVYPRGWLEVELIPHTVRLAAVYGPAAGPAISDFWDATARWLGRRVGRAFMMLGDYNAGASNVDAPGYRFRAGNAFGRLSAIGLVDCWRREHGDAREYTWFSRPGRMRPGRGFRIDHAFASPSLAGRVTGCRYDHEVRERGWSDHSLLVVDLALTPSPAPASAAATPPVRGRSSA